MRKAQGIKNDWLLAAIGGCAAAAVSVLLSVPAAKLMEAGVLPIGWCNITAYLILGLSAAVGAIITVLKGKRKIMLLCLTQSAVFYIVLIVMNGILQKGEFERIWQTAAVILIVSGGIGLLLAGKKRHY